MNLRRNHLAVSACLLALFLFAPGSRAFAKESAAPAACLSQGWPQDRNDLKPDPALTFGSLKNGIRYVIMPNHEPKKRVGMYLDVQAGSLNETEAQRGAAHYLEHMMFNGTTHYPPGTMVEYFQSIGMEFGPDTNAHTAYDETVYQLLLPNGDQKTLTDGLIVLSDYAAGALLLPKETNRERGVILAEKRERDSATRRVFRAKNEHLFAGTLIERRDVIGTDEVLNTADAALLKQFYAHWYRPDNLIVVVVGDADPALVEKLIKQLFSPLPAKAEPPACPDLGQLAATANGPAVLYQHEPDLGYASVSLGSAWNLVPKDFTRAGELQRLKDYVAVAMMNNRLQHLTTLKGSPMTWAGIYLGRMAASFGYADIESRTSAKNWESSLKLLETSLRQALTAGFSEAELKRAKSEMLTSLRKQVQAAASRTSSELADAIIRTLNDREVIMSPEQELELFGPALEQLTLAEANQAFRGLWKERRTVQVAGAADLTGGKQKPEEIVSAAFNAAEQAELAPWQQVKEASFPYLPAPAAKAAVKEHLVYDKIGAERYVFANGLILNLKQTDFEPNEVKATAVFGSGELSEPKPGLAALAQLLVPESGLGGLDKDQLEAALAPYVSRVSFSAAEDSFQFKGTGLKSETETLFQLLHAHIYDPAFRPDAFARIMQKAEQMYAHLQSSVEGMMELRGEQFLAGGNPRYGLPPLEELRKLSLAEVRDWLEPELRNAAVEISVVGDFDKEAVLKLAGQYFGSQPRPGGELAKGERIVFPSGKKLTVEVATDSNKAQVTVAWPTDDFWDIARTRRLGVLASVLDDRLRKQIREEMGAAYSPYVYNQSSTVDPGYGVLRSVMVVDPAQAIPLTSKLKQVGAQLAAGPVSKDELERALEPTLISIRDMVRTNSYWLDSVLINSSRKPQRLEWPQTIQSDFAAITAEDVAALAKRYLGADKAAEVILVPAAKK